MAKPLLVHTSSGDILCFESYSYLQCVAQTTRGYRCRNGAEFSVESVGAVASTYGLLRNVQYLYETTDELFAQHCEVHNTDLATDVASPDWEYFDLDRHAFLIDPLPDTWKRIG